MEIARQVVLIADHMSVERVSRARRALSRAAPRVATTEAGDFASDSSSRSSVRWSTGPSWGTPMMLSRSRARLLLVDERVLDEQLGLDVEDAGRDVGALDVPPDPEDRLRDPAQHDAHPLACCCCCWCLASVGPGVDVGERRALVGGTAGVGPDADRLDRRRRRLVALAHDPGVLGPAAAAAVHDELALGQGDPGQTAGQHPDVVAVVDRERSQVDVPRAGRRRR